MWSLSKLTSFKACPRKFWYEEKKDGQPTRSDSNPRESQNQSSALSNACEQDEGA